MGKVVDKLQDIKAWATGDVSLLYALLPGGQLQGNEFCAGSLKGEAGQSLKYNVVTGIWKDFATGDAGGDIFDLVRAVRGCTLAEAVEYIGGNMGLTDDKERPKIKKKQYIQELVPAPRGIPAPTGTMINGKMLSITNLWAYHDHTGAVIMYDARVDFADGSKMVVPMHWAGDSWRNGTLADNRPLYNMHKIPEAKSLVIVEGCKTAAAMEQYFPNSTIVTWQGGSNAVLKTDWTPISNKERVIIIPDADMKTDPHNGQPIPWEEQPGMKAATQIAKILFDQGCTVYFVNTQSQASKKDGWDMADALAEGWEKSKVLEFINSHLEIYGRAEKDVDIDDIEFDYGEKTEGKPEEIIKGYDCDYYKILGRHGKKYCIYLKQTKAVVEYTAKDIASKGGLMEIAPLQYWHDKFGVDEVNKKGEVVRKLNWDTVANHIMQESQKAGLYDVQAVRGRGAWKDQNRTVVNVGNSLIVLENNKEPYTIETHALDTKYVYETRPRVDISLRNPLKDEHSAKLIECCRLVRWADKRSGDILAGWIFASFVGGILPMRSHIYIAGAKESGKSWVIKNIVNRIFGDYKLSVGGVSTEAGIRSALGSDAFPVIFDESEAEDQSDKDRMQRIFNLARLAATNEGNNVAKGSASGEAQLYSVRSSFLFASINPSMTRDADISRTIKITIKDPPIGPKATKEEKEQDMANFLKLEQAVSRLLTPEYCQALFTRAVLLCDNIMKSVKIISTQAALVGGSKRFGDQLGMIIAGIWHLKTSAVIDETHARELISLYQCVKAEDMSDYSRSDILDWFLQQEVSYSADGFRNVLKIGEAVEILLSTSSDWGVQKNQAMIAGKLAMQGLLVDAKKKTITVATSKGLVVCNIFDRSVWGEAGWKDAVLRIPGATRILNKIEFGQLSKSNAITIPLEPQE